jgi:tetratricopeptide (TPR) repeat protein
MKDVFDVQSRIADQVVRALDVTLHPAEQRDLAHRPTDNLQAYEYYLHGRLARCDAWVNDCAEAMAMFERAVALDSGFALAWAMRSKTGSAMYHWDPGHAAARVFQAKQAADRALALGPELPEAHEALGFYFYWCLKDRDRALREFAVAAARRPNDPDIALALGSIHRRQGAWAAATAEFERSAHLDPGSLEGALVLANTYLFVHDYARAITTLDRALVVHPDVADLYVLRAEAYLAQTGDAVSTGRQLEQALTKLGATRFGSAIWPANQAVLWRSSPGLLPLLESVTIETAQLDSTTYYLSRLLYRQGRGDAQRALSYADSLRRVLEPAVRQAPRDANTHLLLGRAYAVLHRPAEAVREADRAVELSATDTFDEPRMRKGRAIIYGLVNKPDSAVAELERLLNVPSPVAVPFLRLDPAWDPLRGNARFQRLVSGQP